MIQEVPTKRTGPWKLSDLESVPKHGKTVFSCFHCGGGSTMGYKLAGFDVLGGVEIDPEMMEIYRKNHRPKFSYLMGVQEFKTIPTQDLPKELFNLDILDGSPPCSSFSMAGSREKKWGEASKFREGQAVQVLDDLFFHFIDVAEKLKPKVIVSENVKGLILGKARGYVKEIFRHLDLAGYESQLFLLNASRMGVPQARERTFFVARRKDLCFQKLSLEFTEKVRSVCDAFNGLAQTGRKLSAESTRIWNLIGPGKRFSDVQHGSRFNDWKLPWSEPAGTIIANGTICHPAEPRHLSDQEYCRIQSFPDDFDFCSAKAQYVCGMSVPPFMMQRVALEILKQWLLRDEMIRNA